MGEAKVIEFPGLGRLQVVEDQNGDLSLISEELKTWLVTLRSVDVATDEGARTADAAPVGVAFGTALATALPLIGPLLSQGGDLVVQFAPALSQGLADGSLRLLASGAVSLPTAVSTSTGQIAGTATVVGAAGGTAAIGAAAFPLVIAAGAAFAATWSQQRWLEKTFAGFQQSLNRIETRMRDSDLGRLDATDRLLGLIGADAMTGQIPPHLRTELAIAHHEADAIYCSRLRFIDRFASNLDRWQEKAVKEDGRRVAWTPEVVKALSDDQDPTVDELVVFFQSMLTRARTTAATAAVLAADNEAGPAIRMIEELQESIRRDYYATHNRLRALAREPMDTARWKQRLSRADEDEAYRTIKLLAGNLDQEIGQHLPDRDAVAELRMPGIQIAS